MLPGVVDVHTHTRLPTEERPDRFYDDSVAAAFGGTTTFLAFNNPGTGISEGGASSLLRGLAEFRSRTEGESAVDYGLSSVVTPQQADPMGELPALIGSGVPTFKAFMVYDFRLSDDRLFELLRVAGHEGGMLEVHCENATIIDALVADAVEAGHVACRYHAQTRPAICRGGGDPPRDRPGARGRCAALHRPPHLRRCPRGGGRGQGARLAGVRRDDAAVPASTPMRSTRWGTRQR